MSVKLSKETPIST